MQTTNIHWADYSLNYVTGCTMVGPECANCYAMKFTKRQAAQETGPEYASEKDWDGSHAEDVVVVHDGTPTYLDKQSGETVPTKDRRHEPYDYHWPEGPGRVFVVSMGDLFHRLVPDTFITDCIRACRDFPDSDWIFLTKRPDRAADLLVDWPDNAWVGTSVGTGPGGEYPDMTHRIDQLRKVDAAVRWVSAEPLIEPLGEVDLTGIDWMVVGGESAPDEVRREMDVTWAQDLYRQCREQDTRFFFKQGSARYPGRERYLPLPSEGGGLYTEQMIEEFPESR